MIPRPMMLTGLLGAAVGVPYAVNHAPDNWGPNTTNGPAEQQQQVDPSLLVPPQPAYYQSPGSEVYVSPAPIEGYRNLSLGQLLNWNITKDWVYAGWARKSTGLADLGLYGVRVPVVTGSQMTDIAGALSYYFDHAGQLQRIRLHGRTADTTELVRLVTSQFGLRPVAAPIAGEQWFEAVEKKQLRAELRTRPESVLWSTSPHSSFAFDLELNRPGSDYWVVRKAPQLNIAGLEEQIAQAQEVKKPESNPILPHRKVVPDAANTQAQAEATRNVEPRVEKPKIEAKPASTQIDKSIAPLRTYRDRFRWPD